MPNLVIRPSDYRQQIREGDYVELSAPAVRDGLGGKVVIPRAERHPLQQWSGSQVKTEITIEGVLAGPLRVAFYTVGAPPVEFDVNVPDRGQVLLSDLIKDSQPYTPPVVSEVGGYAREAGRAKIAAEQARDQAQGAAGTAQGAKTAAELARDRAEQARDQARSAKDSAEQARDRAEQAKNAATQAQTQTAQDAITCANHLVFAQEQAQQAQNAAQNIESVVNAAGQRWAQQLQRGPKGDRGERGEPGPAGPAGPRGERGEPGQSGAAQWASIQGKPNVVDVVRANNSNRGALVACWNDGMLHCENNPTSHNHLARKGYVDGVGSTSPTANSVARRDNGGRIQGNDAVAAKDLVNKSFLAVQLTPTETTVGVREGVANSGMHIIKMGRVAFMDFFCPDGTPLSAPLPAPLRPAHDITFNVLRSTDLFTSNRVYTARMTINTDGEFTVDPHSFSNEVYATAGSIAYITV